MFQVSFLIVSNSLGKFAKMASVNIPEFGIGPDGEIIQGGKGGQGGDGAESVGSKGGKGGFGGSGGFGGGTSGYSNRRHYPPGVTPEECPNYPFCTQTI